MMKRLSVLLALGLLAGGVIATSSALELGKDPKAEPTLVEDKLGQESAEKMVTALKLKEYGWGKQSKKGLQDANIDLLIASARMLRQLPAPRKLEDVTVEVTRDKDAPEGDTKVPEGEAFNPGKEAEAILARASELVEATVTDKKKAEAYNTLIQELKDMGQTKAIAGGPKAVRRDIPPGHTHTYNWHWIAHLPGMVGFQSNMPMRVQVVQDNGGYIFADGVTMGANPHFLPGGPGKPAANKKVRITVRVHNFAKVKGHYVLGAQ